ncbi:hypothetical protein G9A89_020563 [Geosiphon pyriformis]|nr:hypothetical protein G9A89_020563 [Geosiphon pyriformis]
MVAGVTMATTPDTTTLEYYQSIYTHCKQRFNIPDEIEVVKKSVYQYIENHINNYLFGNYNISEKNESNHSESLESEETEPEPEEATENKEEMATAYIAKIPEFTGEDNDTSSQEWLDKVQKAGDANGWNAAKMLKTIPYFLQGTAEEWFKNLEEPFENWQAFKDAFLQQFTDNNTSITLRNHFHNIKQETSETFIAGLKDKLIKKVCLHASADLATAIRHAKNYEMAMEKANHTKLVNLAIGETSLAAEEKIDQLTKKLVLRNSGQQRPNHYHTQPSYLKIPEESDFQQSALSESEVAAPRSNSSNNTIPPAQIAQNANLSDIFPFKFEANESPFLLSNTAANEQKAITAMYTEATLQRTVDRPAQIVIVIADDMKKTPVGEIDNFLFTIDGITILVKVLIIDTLQYQALELKILYQRQYTIVLAICSTFNKQSEKAPVFEFEEEKEMPLIETYMALGLTSNWAKETKQEIFEELRGWKKVRYSILEPWKQPPYILLKCKDCNKKLSSMEACISSEKEYETRICYFCKACHRERFGFPKRSRKWNNTPYLTCRNMLPEEYNWIDVVMRGRVCDQTCQYALSISEKVRKGTSFDAAYNSALNKLYHYPHDAEIIFDLAIALINGAT